MQYEGWELNFFDNAKNFRKYQLDLIRDYLGESVLEIGPGNGSFSKECVLINTKKLTLSELDTVHFQKLKKEFNLIDNVTVVQKKINELDEQFNTILYLDVLEHIDDHEQELKLALEKLKTGGFLVIISPAFQYLYSAFDHSIGHKRRYEKEFFLEFSKKNDINYEKIEYFDTIGYFFAVINKILNIKNSKINFGVKIWNLLIPLSKILDKVFFNSFGKSLICIYRK